MSWETRIDADTTAKQDLDKLKADFLSTVSHELRTPLTLIKGYLAMLMSDQAPDRDQALHFLEVMARQTTRLERLVDDLLDAASLQHHQRYVPEPVDWPHTVDGVAAVVGGRFPDHAIKVMVADGVPAVLAYRERAGQILDNVLTNACKYSLPSTVTVTVAVDDARDCVCTTVRDEGPGIAVEDRERIFERFTRLGNHMRRTVGGAGLGLFIAKQLVEAMHGTITVTDAPTGACFTFTLPTAPAMSSAMAGPTTPDVVHAAM